MARWWWCTQASCILASCPFSSEVIFEALIISTQHSPLYCDHEHLSPKNTCHSARIHVCFMFCYLYAKKTTIKPCSTSLLSWSEIWNHSHFIHISSSWIVSPHFLLWGYMYRFDFSWPIMIPAWLWGSCHGSALNTRMVPGIVAVGLNTPSLLLFR